MLRKRVYFTYVREVEASFLMLFLNTLKSLRIRCPVALHFYLPFKFHCHLQNTLA